jgi:hypothetical protein
MIVLKTIPPPVGLPQRKQKAANCTPELYDIFITYLQAMSTESALVLLSLPAP